MSKSYTELDAWQKGRKLANIIYTVTSKFPKEETYGLVSQMRRAGVSIPSKLRKVLDEIPQRIQFNFYIFQEDLHMN